VGYFCFMQIPLLPKAPIFPDPNNADADGLVGLSTDLSPERILAAYEQGIFPWFQDQGFYFWFSPDPRMVLHPEQLRIHKSMRPYLNQNRFRVTFDKAFKAVMENCSLAPRPGQESTWISPEFVNAYHKVHLLGFAHSVEVWDDEELIGGLYGLSLGRVFFGESMFSKKPNASKYGFIKLVQWLKKRGFNLIDCQVYTRHLAYLGARNVKRADFLVELNREVHQETLAGKWHYSED
jgi:leucyl/phenylalanyl-tRNA--protein transferase